VPWLRLSLPIALIGGFTSLAGIFRDATYANETANWSAQGVGQDVANLVAFAAMLVFGRFAARGAPAAYAAWLGCMIYTVYAFAIYAFAIHFGPLFPAYVAVLGLSVYALGGGLFGIREVKWRLVQDLPIRSIGWLLSVLGLMFYGLWLGEIITALAGDEVPQSVIDAGLPINPVHVLDLAVMLPALILAGVALRRRRAWAFLVAPALLVAVTLLGVGILAASATLAIRGEEVSAGPVLLVSVLTVVEVVAAARFLRALGRNGYEGVPL
jgi:hypothetical protein